MAGKVELDLKLIIGAVALVILATVGSAFTTYLIFGGTGSALSSSEPAAVNDANGPRPVGPMFEVGDFTVNISTPTAQPRFIRTGIVLELNNERGLRQELESRHPQVRDRIISILRTRSIEQLNGSRGLEELRRDIVQSINELLPRGEVVDAFFMDLVIQ